MNIRQIIGENVRCFRNKMNWSQEALGAQTGLHHDYLGRLERGRVNISVENLLKIAQALNVDPHLLLIEGYCYTG